MHLSPNPQGQDILQLARGSSLSVSSVSVTHELLMSLLRRPRGVLQMPGGNMSSSYPSSSSSLAAQPLPHVIRFCHGKRACLGSHPLLCASVHSTTSATT